MSSYEKLMRNKRSAEFDEDYDDEDYEGDEVSDEESEEVDEKDPDYDEKDDKGRPAMKNIADKDEKLIDEL